MHGQWKNGGGGVSASPSYSQYQGAPTYRASDWQKDPSGKWHFTGHRHKGQQSSGGRLWTCSGCKSTNHSKNACSTCGMRRSWAEMASSPQSTDLNSAAQWSMAPPQTNQVTAKLEQVASKLLENVSSSAAAPPSGAGQSVAPTNAVPSPATTVTSALAQERSAIQCSIKALENAISSLVGDEFQEQRRIMQEQIEAKKRLLIVSKPIGQRLDNTRAASQRALKRLEQAKGTARLAQEALAAAEMESANLAKELQDLEAEVAANTSANDVEMQDSAACNPIACLEKQLAATVRELKTVGNVSGAVVKDAEEQAALLLSRFKNTIHTAKTVAREDGGATLRKEGKQAP